MNLDEQKHRYRALNDWFCKPQGMQVVDALALKLLQLNPSWPRNAHILQLGLTGDKPLISSAYTYTLTPCQAMPNASCIASPKQLPFKRNSIDIIVAPFLFEIFGSYQSPLDEIDRVLSPMGYVVFLGINPVSLWGLALKLGYLSELGQSGMQPHFPLSIRQALFARGFEQDVFEMFHYIPPFKQQRWIKKSLFLNEMGKIMPIFPAGFYLLIMQKYQGCTVKALRRSRREALWLAG